MLSELENIACIDIGYLMNEIVKEGDIENISDETIMKIIEKHITYQKVLRRMFKNTAIK